jgi:hypothetical protein
MCPYCIASAGLIAASVVSAGGIGAVAAKIFRSRTQTAPNSSQQSNNRRNDHGIRNRETDNTENRIPR